MTSRRHFLAATAVAGMGLVQGAEVPSLGLIFPPSGRGVPEEGLTMYPNRVNYLVETLGLETMTPEGYDAVLDRIPPAAEKLAKRGAKAVMLLGTSLTFYKGAEFNQRLTDTIKKATGLPCATMSTGVIEGLKDIKAKRVAVPTAYNEEVNGRLRIFLKENGFEALQIKGMGVEKVEDILLVKEPQLLKFCTDVAKSTQGADSILVSCGGLITLPIIAPLEKATGLPAVTSTPHALRLGMKLLGVDSRAKGFGTLLAKA
jgi:arylmalonate decarboxylase